MEIELKNIESKEEAIKYIKQEVDKFDYDDLWSSQKKVEDQLFRNPEMLSEFLSEEEIIKIYYNHFIKTLSQKEMDTADKKFIFVKFNSLFNSNVEIKKEAIDKEAMKSLTKQIFKKLSYDWQKMLIEFTTDKEKIKFLETNREQLINKEKMNIIKSIDKDDLKLETLKRENLNYLYRLKVISTLKEDTEKKKLIAEIEKKHKKNKKDKELMMITPEDILSLISTFKNPFDIKDALEKVLSISYIKQDIKDYPTILQKHLFKNIPDDKFVFELIQYFENNKINISLTNIVKSMKTMEGMSILNEKYLLTKSQKIVLAFKVIQNEEEAIKWIKENTDLEEKLKNISQKKYKNQDMDLPKDLTVGVELEAEGLAPDNIRQIIRNMPIKKSIFKKWVIKEERSLNHGTEIISPVMNSAKQNLNELEYVCDFMNAIGMSVNRNCGGHIHYGASYLEKNLNYWKNFISIWFETEELIYKMSNDIGEKPRDGVFEYAKKESENIAKTCKDGSVQLDTDEDFADLVLAMTPGRFFGLNLVNLQNPNKYTIEIRIPNGTIDNRVQKENIKFFGKMIAVSKEICTDEKAKEKFEALKNRELSEEEKVETFLDLLFEKEEDKKIYRDRWNSVKNYKIFYKLQSKLPKFKKEKSEEFEL